MLLVGPFKRRERLLALALCDVEDRPLAGRDVLLARLQACQDRLCPLAISRPRIGRAEIDLCAGRVKTEPDRLLVGVDSLREHSLGGIREAQEEMRVWIVLIHSERLLQGLNRLIVLACRE